MDISILIAVIGVLVALTNIIVEVVKKTTHEIIPTNILAVIVAEVLTIAAGIAYCQIEVVAITWHIVVALVVAGFMVSYAAMFGFDKLKEVMNWNSGNP